ncbi:hypothetical protein D9758_012734 [Tetrapyrgos nigripes]|uniref:Uncharacterized protein n=1 Tax=Tetrapyrgos nigripes TaxID=182062 RepID=A0A8H5CYM8_9AGAR|nr:hypothetical protein D9758_012734 [Tetrapyrgos nigripes]
MHLHCNWTIIATLLSFSFIASPPVSASANFTQCLQAVKNGEFGLDGGRDNKGNSVNVSEATAISYDLCIAACGSGPSPFVWSAFSQQFTSWLLPWLALISQLPFGANDKLDNFISVLLAVGSPVLAAYSVMLTVLNSRWVAHMFHKISYPNVRSAVRILSSLQQAPVRVSRDPHLLPSLVVLPHNDEWWDELIEYLGFTYSWSVSAASSLIWVLLAYIFTIIESFTVTIAGIAQLFQINGQGVGSVWLWLLPVVLSWLQISPKCDSLHIEQAVRRANELAHVATANPHEPVRASTIDTRRAIYLRHGQGSLHTDERCTSPIFNYARIFSWTITVEEVAYCFRQASKRAGRFEPVGQQKWVRGDRNIRVQMENRVGTALEVQEYCGYYPDLTMPPRWGAGVWSRILVASLLALFLQWGTTGAALLIAWWTPTRGLGCRSASYLGYACLSTLVWAILLLSTILSHYSTFSRIDPMNGQPIYNTRSWLAAGLSVALRRLAKVLATINAIGIVVMNIFQFSGLLDRCYCDSSVIGLGKSAYSVINLVDDDVSSLRAAWIGGVILALGSATLFVGVLNLLINPPLPEA